MFIGPYFNLRGTAREALEFYQTVLGGELSLTTFDAFNDQTPPEYRVDPAELGWVMHGQLTLATGQAIALSDIPSKQPYTELSPSSSVFLVGEPSELDDLSAKFEKLSEGGTIQMEFQVAPWGDHYGSFFDKFGILWQFNIAAA